MALKFLNKKGWHTGSLRNIENVWKAEQKHDAEQKKLEELRKQIAEERERAEFRQLQEQAGLVPKQERLDFLYESGLAVGKGSSEVFKSLQGPSDASASSSAAVAPPPGAAAPSQATPGALFEEKPQSANDAWRKLHSDPLLLIRQREQEALSRIKSNPVQMAMIRKSVESEKTKKEQKKKEKHSKKDRRKKHSRGKSKHSRHSKESSEESSEEMDGKKRAHLPSERNAEHSKRDRYSSRVHYSSKELWEAEDVRKQHRPSNEERSRRNRDRCSSSEREEDHRKQDKYPSKVQNSMKEKLIERRDARKHHHSLHEERHRSEYKGSGSSRHIEHGSSSAHLDTDDNKHRSSNAIYGGSGHNNRRTAPKLSQEEREARLREMQLDAELHEEQRWKRLKKASEQDAQEAFKDKPAGRNFLDAAQKSIYGTEKGGSSTIEESVRRRTFYSQGGSAAEETNAFRR